MDSSSSSTSHNWLAFSLSNPSSSPFPLFSSPSPTTLTLTGSTTVDAPPPEPTAVGPKFEDFLGGGTTSGVVENDIYDSELKTIAASFLRGFASAADPPPQKPPMVVVAAAAEPSPKKSVDTFGQRTSIYRGVTRHRWTGRYEAHLWDNSCRREGQSRKGRQVYLGGYDKEEKAARAYDLAALKYWGPTTTTNFPISNYQKELEAMKNMTRQEFVASLRRKSSGFSRGASIYRGVTRHHQHGRWQARIGRVAGNKDLYLGTFSTQEEAAEAYDIAAIKFRGLNAVTNFDMSRYDVKSIANSSLPIGGLSGTSKAAKTSPADSPRSTNTAATADDRDRDLSANSSVTFASSQPPPPLPPLSSSSGSLSFAIPIKQDTTSDHHYWSILAGYNNDNKSPSLVQSSSPFNVVDFSRNQNKESNNNINNSGGGAFFNGGIYVHQQSNGGVGNNINANNVSSSSSSSLIPLGTPSSSGYESSSSGYGNWTLHTFHQTHSKPTLFQTPIFGME